MRQLLLAGLSCLLVLLPAFGMDWLVLQHGTSLRMHKSQTQILPKARLPACRPNVHTPAEILALHGCLMIPLPPCESTRTGPDTMKAAHVQSIPGRVHEIACWELSISSVNSSAPGARVAVRPAHRSISPVRHDSLCWPPSDSTSQQAGTVRRRRRRRALAGQQLRQSVPQGVPHGCRSLEPSLCLWI